ncbi:MAG: rane dipeptidase [Bacteroidetes bacterium]|nr:rane dipeptidase [Bacteroidota bacterium]
MTRVPGYSAVVFALVAATSFVRACGPAGPADTSLQDRASALARRILILDSHMDVPYRLTARMADISERTFTTDFDYPRAREGGLKAAFLAVYVPQRLEEAGGALEHALRQIALVEGLVKRSPGKFAFARTPDEVRSRLGGSQVLFSLGMENGIPLEHDLRNVRMFFDRGIRYITLVHARDNSLADASFDTTHTWGGLSPFGREVIGEMNRVGMIIDVSHMSDSAFTQTLRLSTAPVVATHSSCRAFTPGLERNMSDEMIRELAAHGGVIQINFASSFLVDSIRQQMATVGDSVGQYLREHNLHHLDEKAVEYTRSYRREKGVPYADVRDIAKHIDHVAKLVGVDYVGLGSDFEGLGDDLPTGMKDVTGYPNLIRELLLLGYDEPAIEKICGGNFLRVWEEVLRSARLERSSEE